MRRATRRGWIASVAVPLSIAMGACDAGREAPPCGAPEEYPACTGEGTGVRTCQDGAEVVVPCALEGETCLDLVDAASGARVSECLPADTVGCDPSEFLPYCAAEDTLVACVAPAAYPTVGHSERVACAEGESCQLDGDGGACVRPPDPGRCDPATFVGQCEAGSAPVACVEDRIVTQPPCVPPNVCLVGPQGAVCAPEPTCDPARFEPRCVTQETRIRCSALGQEVAETCSEWSECRTGENGGFCVSSTAQPCDPATFAPACNTQSSYRVCSAVTAFTESHGCGSWSRCVDDQGLHGPVCIPWNPFPH